MHSNQNEANKQKTILDNKKLISVAQSTYQKEEREILGYIKKYKLDGITIKRHDSGAELRYYILDVSRKMLSVFGMRQYAHILLCMKKDPKFVTLKHCKLALINIPVKSEGLFTAGKEIYGTIKSFVKFVSAAANDYKNDHMVAWLIDMLTSIMDLNDPFFWRPLNLLKFLMRFYSILTRFTAYKKLKSQSLFDFSSIDAILLAIAALGVPTELVNKITLISKFTSKKILDTPNIFMDLIHLFFECLLDAVQYIQGKLEDGSNLKVLLDYLAYPIKFLTNYRVLNDLNEVVIKFNKNSQIIFDPVYRQKVLEMSKNLKENLNFQTLLTQSSYAILRAQYTTFMYIVKLATNFSSSKRSEPVCFVLEGKAGTFKSTFMNLIVQYLSRSRSVYTHTVPSVDAGKDFYDDYLSQDVFVMDDVGQQGVSQWRQMINYVSPVKYPLECAQAELKNTKFFDSKLLILTTNHFSDLRNFTKTDCISEPEALFRRAHILNFNDVKLGLNGIEGKIVYKKYNFITKEWITNDFIPNFKVPKNIPGYVESEDRVRAVAWCVFLMEHMLSQSQLNEEANTILDHEFDDISKFIREENFSNKNNIPLNESECVNLPSLDLIMEYAKNYMQEIMTRLEINVNSFIESPLKYGLNLFGTAAVVYSLSKLFDTLFGKLFSKADDLSSNSILRHSVGVWREACSALTRRLFVPALTIGKAAERFNNFISQGKSTILDTIKSRMRVIHIIDDSGFNTFQQCIVSGKRILVNRHAYTVNKGIINLYKDWNAAEHNVLELNNMPFKVIKEWPECDLSIIEIPTLINLYKDCSAVLFPETETELCSDIYLINSEIVLPINRNYKLKTEDVTITNSANKAYTLRSCESITYELSADGLCGTLLVDNVNGLCGFHVAGDGEEGISALFSKSVLSDLKNYLTSGESLDIVEKKSILENYSGIKLFQTDLSSKRTLDKTSLVPSELFQPLTIEAEKQGEKAPPNFIKFGGKTLEQISRKSFKPIPRITQEEIEFAKVCLSSFMIDFKEVSDNVVIRGDGEFISMMNKDSVNGYGYDELKTNYINFSEGKITPLFEQQINEFKQRCNANALKVEDLLFYETFKDELRPLGKVDKPRSFRVAPLHHTFLVKKYMAEVLAHIKQNMWSNQIAIGMNPYRDWQRLYSKLASNESHFDGDVGNWDGGCPAQIQDAVVEVMLSFYKGTEYKVLETLLLSMVRTFVMIKEELYHTTHSMPSGCWVTALFNSFYNRMFTAITLYREMKKDGKIAQLIDFMSLTDFVLGDDKVCGAPARYSKYFNALTVKDFFNSIGMDYTDGEKGLITSPSKPLQSLVFLKRSFQPHTQLKKVVGPLSLATLVNSLRFYDKTKDYDVVMNGKLTAFQFEIYLHENLKLKDEVLNLALQSGINFTAFSDKQIALTMESPTAYADIQRLNDKYYNY